MFTDLYHIKNLNFSEGKLTASASLNANHEIFRGHFPGQPVLPGVCQLALIKDILEKYVGHALSMAKGDQIKFMAMVDPRRTPELEVAIQVSDAEGFLVAQTVISSHETTFLKSKARFANA